MDVEIFFYSINMTQGFGTPVRFVVLLANTALGKKSWEKSDTLSALRDRLDLFVGDLNWEAIERDLTEVGQHRCSSTTLTSEFPTRRE